MKRFFYALVSVLLLEILLGAGAAPALAQGAPGGGAPQAGGGSTTAGDFKSQSLLTLTVMGRRLVVMAGRIPAEKFTWDPGLGGRSVAELFLHTAYLNFIRPPQFGATPPEGFHGDNTYEKSMTDKAKIIDQMTQAFAYSEAAIGKLSDADMQRHIKVNGVDTTVSAFLSAWTADVSEYVGQAIVYTRLNGAMPVPPNAVVGPNAVTK